MAAGDGVRWFLKLLLDKRSKKEVQRETQQALNKGTDPKQAKKNVGQVEGAFGKLKKAAIALGGVLASLWVVRRVVEYGKAIFNLGAQVAAVKSQFEIVFGEAIADNLERGNEALRRMAGLSRTEFRQILAGAGSMGQGMGMAREESAAFAEQVLALSADLASFSGTQYSTAQAAKLVQSALIGNTEATRPLLVNFTALDVTNRALEQTGKATADALTQQEKATAALSVITERAGPQIGNLADTEGDADNKAKRLGGSVQDLKESLSLLLTEGSGVGQIFGDLTTVLVNLDGSVRANADGIQKWAGIAVSSAVAVGRTVGNVIKIIFQAATTVSTSIATVLLGATGVITTVIDQVARSINWIIDQVNRLPRVNIDFRINRNLDPDKFFAAAGKGVDTLQKKLGSIDGSTRAIADAWTDVAKAAGRAQTAQEAAATVIPPDASTAPTPTGGVAGGGGGTAAIEADLAARGLRGVMFSPIPIDQIERDKERAISAVDHMALAWYESTSTVASDIEATFGTMFSTISEGGNVFNALGEAAAGVGSAVVSGMTENMAEWQFAEGLADLAAGGFPPNPAAIAAASTHFAAAAAFKTVGAAASAAAGGGSASVGGAITGRGGARLDRDLPETDLDRERRGPDINIHLDGVDPDNPRHHELIGRATREYEERWGGKVRFNRRRG